MTTESRVRRIVVGVDGSAESVAALRWACREASFCAAEVLAVLALESSCHQIASYAVPVPRHPGGSWGAVREVLRRAVGEAVREFPGVRVRTDIAEGLAARVLLDHASDAVMLVLGRTPYGPDPVRAAGPVTRACLRASVCPVVIIGSGPLEPLPAEVPLAPQGAEHPVDHLPPSWQRDLEGSGATR
jgi:nucleotide-binding universal stress UspA family protein